MRDARDAEEQLLLLETEEARRKLEKDFRLFYRKFWRTLNPNARLAESWYLDAIAEHLMAVRAGQVSRLIINQPPRTGKTSVGTEMFPCWWWATDPAERFAFYSYAFNLSVASSLRRRRIIESKEYQELWGGQWEMEEDENTRHRFVNTLSGAMTILTGATGMGGNVLIVDDLHNTEQAESDADRAAGVEKFRTGLMTRLDNPETSPVIVIGQRLHDKDICGELLRDGGWTHLCLPAEARSEQAVFLPVSKRHVVRTPDNDLRLLDPKRLSDKVLAERKVALGTLGYEGQYQQSPSPPGGSVFLSEWFRMYPSGHPPSLDQVVVSVDASFGSLTADASNVAIHAWGMAGVDSYLVGRLTKKMGFADTKAAIRRMAVLHGADTLLVEKKANGAAIIEELESEWVVIPYNPDWGDKRMRAEASTPMVEAGTVHLPDDEDGHEVRALAARFPNAVQDDDVDAMSAFLNWRRKRGRFMEWWRYLAGQADRKDDKPAGPEGKTGDEIRREMHEASLEALGISRRKKRQPDPSAPGTPPPSVPVERDVGHGGTPAINAQPPPPPAPPLLPCSCGMTRWFCGSRGRKCMSCGEVVEYPNPK